MYYVGIDGGGTKSEYILMDEELNVISSCISSATNINSHGYDFVLNSISEGINGLLNQASLCVSDIKAICIGSAGVDKESDKENYETILKKMGFINCLVVNDSEIALSAGTKGKPGIIAISGTGSIVYGVNKGLSGRVGGWGHLIGDEGSGYSIAERGIRKAIHFSDGYGNETKLYDAILDAIDGKNPSDFLDFIYSKNFNKSKIAALSKIVDCVANDGDKVATEILMESANDLFNQIDALIKSIFKNDEIVRLVFNGSVIKNSKIFRNQLMYLLNDRHKNIEVMDLSDSASLGAVYLAKGFGE